jgi:hypothetical protein
MVVVFITRHNYFCPSVYLTNNLALLYIKEIEKMKRIKEEIPCEEEEEKEKNK